MSLEQITQLVKDKAGEEDWSCHASLVVKNALILAELKGADKQIVELGALLHDIALFILPIEDRSYEAGKDHEIKGVPIAEEILLKHGYSRAIIDEVLKCVAHHRKVPDSGDTIFSKIIRDADALSHFDAVPYLLRIGLKNNDNNVAIATDWVSKKLERDWNTKLHLPESKNIAEEKYKAAKLLLKINS